MKKIKYETPLGKKWDEIIPNASVAISMVLETIERMGEDYNASIKIEEDTIQSDNDLLEFENKSFNNILAKNNEFKQIDDVHKTFVEKFNDVDPNRIQQMNVYENKTT